MKNPSERALKSILCCAVLALPAAHGESRQSSANSAATVPPKARVVAVHPTKKKVFVSVSGVTQPDKAKSARTTTPKVVAARAVPSNSWHLTPKFQKTGKEDITYGFMLNRPF